MRFMRVQRIAICTLAAIAVPELTPTVNATSVASSSETESQQYIVEPVQAAPQNPIISLSSPETQTAPQFAGAGGGGNVKTLSPDNSLDPQQFIVLPEQQTSAINPINNVEESQIPAPIAPKPQLTLAVSQSPEKEAIKPSYIIEPQTGILEHNPVSESQPTAISIPVSPPENITPPNSREQNNAQALLPVKPTTLSQTNSNTTIPSPQEIQNIQNQLGNIQQNVPEFGDIYRGSPALTITNPSGFGADNNTGYIGVGYQSRVRYTDNQDDGGIIIGAGFGDARKSVGVEISYTLASLTSDNTEFGRGGFNLKVHRQFPGDIAVAAGWNGFLNIGDNDFENSLYAVGTKVIRLQDDLRRPFSRLALTAGIGNGQFRSENDVEQDRGTVNVFGSAALRVIEPISLIAEWTGQDLALGASIVPFKNFPFVITPAFRDITGAGDGARFVLGAGFSFQF